MKKEDFIRKWLAIWQKNDFNLIGEGLNQWSQTVGTSFIMYRYYPLMSSIIKTRKF